MPPIWPLIEKIIEFLMQNQLYLVAALVLLLFLLGYGFYYFFVKQRHDVFLAIPMAAADKDPAKKQELKELAHDLTAVLQNDVRLAGVYSAWRNLENPATWDEEQFALPTVLAALRASKYFIMVYPEQVVTSVLVEAGMAVSYGKPSAWFVKSEDDLPFLLKNGEGASGRDRVPNIRVYIIKDVKDVRTILTRQKLRVFGTSTIWDRFKSRALGD